MAKRFTATEKWDDSWFHSLSKDERTLWNYLTDRCDHAGIWDANLEIMTFHTGVTKYDLRRFQGRIVVLASGKWFIPGFIQFQYGTLNAENRVHFSVIKRLEKLNLWPVPSELLNPAEPQKEENQEPSSKDLASPYLGPSKPLPSPLLGAKDKDSYSFKDKDLILTRARVNGPSDQDFDRFWLLYPKRIKKNDARKAWEKINPTDELRADMYAAIEKQKKTEQWQNRKYIPYPASWLNGRRWEDELELADSEEETWQSKILGEIKAKEAAKALLKQTSNGSNGSTHTKDQTGS